MTSAVDTVENAQVTPELTQPFAELGLKPDEYTRIRKILNRRPTSAELVMYSVMWSEHFSYKSSKIHLRQFDEKKPQTDALLVGIGENAGVVDIGDDWAVAFKVESHNHPSFVEPYQGVATCIGGIVAAIVSMGARPIAVMDALRFGPATAADTARVLPGVVAGIAGYGNCLGLPNIGGEVVFDESYAGSPLVNALCVGSMQHSDIHLAKASGVGNLVILFGAATGRDGIGGGSLLSSESSDQQRTAKRPSVQVGDSFMEKSLIECTLEVLQAGLVERIQDLGGAGIACATSELASNGTGGMHVFLDRVALQDSTLTPEQILMSESQEQMCAVVPPAHLERFLQICQKWELLATVIGEVTDAGRLVIEWRGQTILDVPPRTVVHDGPVYQRPYHRPNWQDALQADAPSADKLARPDNAESLRETILQMTAAPNLASKRWVTDQFDSSVMGNTVLAQPEDAGVVRVDEISGRGVALSTDCNGRFTKLDPYQGARLALAEAYRNVSATGAFPLAVTNCLNFGSPEDPEVMWQFERAATGLADGCLELGTPVTGGNVSFYNQTGSTAILPTPVVGVLGVLDDVERSTPMGWRNDGDLIYLLGDTYDEFGGSEWAYQIHRHLGGLPPRLDLRKEKVLSEILIACSRDGLANAAHDVSDGGVMQSLVEMALRYQVGARIWIPQELDPFEFCYSESATRAVVVIPRDEESRFAGMCEMRQFTANRIGVVDSKLADHQLLRIDNVYGAQIELTLTELSAAHFGTLPTLFGPTVGADGY